MPWATSTATERLISRCRTTAPAASPSSSPDFNLDGKPDLTTAVFVFDPSGIIKAVDVTGLRTAVNAVRAAAGIPAAAFTDAVAPGVIVKAIHVVELRSNLDAARSALGFTAIPYTDPALVIGTTKVKHSHIQQLRLGVKGAVSGPF